MQIKLVIYNDKKLNVHTINPNSKTIDERNTEELIFNFFHTKIINLKIVPNLKKNQMCFVGPLFIKSLYVWFMYYDTNSLFVSVKDHPNVKVNISKPICIFVQQTDTLSIASLQYQDEKFYTSLFELNEESTSICDQNSHSYEEEAYDYDIDA